MALMRDVQDILYNVTGQLVYFDAPEGRPSSVTSATVHAYDAGDDSAAEVAIGSPSVETGPSTTIDAASGAGQSNPNVLNVAATTGMVVGRTYLVTSAKSYREWFEAAEIVSADTVTAKHPLHNAYAASDTVQSTRIQATVDSTWVATLGKVRNVGANPAYRIRWVYVVSSVTYVADTYFNLVRYAGRHGVRPQDVEVTHPGWLDRLPTDHRNDQGRRLIDEAYRQVKLDMAAVEIDDSGIANSEIADELVRWKTNALTEFARLMDGGQSGEGYSAAKGAYQERLDTFVRVTSKAPIRDESGAASVRQAMSLSRR